MIDNIFGSLLACDVCHHGVGLHDPSGCRSRDCGCPCDKDTVVRANVAIATEEFRAQWTNEPK